MKKINQQNNLSIFDCFYPNFKIEKPIRLIELFAGYGSQALSLKYLGIDFEHWFVSEIDKYAIDTYNKFNNTNFETCDIKNIHAKDLNVIETNKYNYILTYSFPCTDLSLAGKREGMEKGSGTRSSLLFEVERILKEIKDSNKELPQVLLMENVPQVLTSKGWDQWYFFLESLGYKNYIEILNSKDFYIPQNRERCFMVSILGNYNYNFPKHVKLKYLLKDYLEENVDEKYYLSEKMIKCFLGMNKKRINFPRKEIFLRCLENTNIKGIATTITTCAGQRPTDNFILIPEKTKLGYAIAEEGDGVYINRPHQKRGVVQKDKIQTLKTSCDDLGVVVENNNIYNLFFAIFDLCCIINTKERDKYERSRELLQILWQEIGKKEIWQEIRRFFSFQEKNLLQQRMYEKSILENWKQQPKISTSTPNSCEYNEEFSNREKMFNMWEEWKIRYTPQRWELSEQQFRKFNIFMQELSYETTSKEESMCNMWKTNERFRILRETLSKIQEIWKPIDNKIQNGLRIRKLTPREVFRLMGVKDEQIDKVTVSNTQQYKQAGNSIVISVLMAIFGKLLDIDYETKIKQIYDYKK